MRPAFSRAHGKLENFRVVETRRDVTTFSLETLRVANQETPPHFYPDKFKY